MKHSVIPLTAITSTYKQYVFNKTGPMRITCINASNVGVVTVTMVMLQLLYKIQTNCFRSHKMGDKRSQGF